MRQRTGREEFWKFTDEEMETAKNTDLPDLLEHLGYHVKRSGSYYTTREMDSLMIKNRRTWKRYSNGKGGDAISSGQSPLHGKRPLGIPHFAPLSLLSPQSLKVGFAGAPLFQEFEGKGFREAVDYLLEFNGRARDAPTLSKPRPPPKEEERPEFVLPPVNSDNRRVFAYLRKRGIASQVIRAFLNAGLLYVVGAKSAPWETPFGHSPLRSLAPPLPTKPEGRLCGGPARAQRSGSRGERRSGEMSEPCRLRRGEGYGARDDAMSFCTLHREVRSNAIALCGVYEGGLNTYLRDNPHLRHVVLCLDDDGPGREAAEKLRAEYEGRGLKVSTRTPPRGTIGAPTKPFYRLRGERRSGEMSEPCRLRRGEGYEARDDANEYLQTRGPPRERGR